MTKLCGDRQWAFQSRNAKNEAILYTSYMFVLSFFCLFIVVGFGFGFLFFVLGFVLFFVFF